MGVPKFFRWISERYPCLSEIVREHEIPEFDNLYLDMNGIIHPCSHPEDDNIHFRMSEEQMFKNVINYVDFIFRMIKPKKVFFMAVDGVAPRAKMNQQRSRRFRSAKEAEVQEAKAVRKGETLPTESRFDSNCITPGTPFMTRLQAALTEFAARRVAEDPLWRGIRVVLSGHQTPGEGEHKIMEFIRYERSRPDYDPDTRHCLYGLDADLIMLGLASHQAHFSLLREEVRFGGKKDKRSQAKASAPETITFFLLHLSLLRDYIDIEFRSIRSDLNFGYDLERIIDDWVLLGFLVGNDFLPHLPDLHIHSEALPLLWNTYKKVLPTIDGYLQSNGEIALDRLQAYFATLAQFDDDTLREKCSDMRWMKGRQGERMARELERLGQPDLLDSFFAAAAAASAGGEKAAGGSGQSDSSGEEEFLADEMQMMKQEYYQGKMGLLYDETERRRQTREYVRGLQWVLYYYYRGVPSWGWYYPQHYAPYISDVRDFADLDLQFDLGHPFLPFQQLMAVLPAASGVLLPECLRPLMVSPDSPIKHFYPVEFESDLNGKKQDWEAVVLIPFIDEQQLLDAMHPRLAQLSQDERDRNCFRPHLLFEWDPAGRRCRTTAIEPFGFRIGADKLAPPACRAAHLPGFPVLHGLPFSAELRKAGVKVFQFASRGENTVLTLTDCQFDEARVERTAAALLGRTVLASWPHLSEVLAVAVSSATRRYTRRPDGSVQSDMLSESDAETVYNEWSLVRQESMSRFGISISDETPCVLTAKTLMGRVLEFGRDGAARKRSQWSQGALPFVLQRCLPEAAPESGPELRIEQALPVGELVFICKGNCYGMSGPVLGHKPNARIQVQLRVRRQPDLTVVDSEDRFLSAQALAQHTGYSGHLVSRITGTVMVTLPQPPKSPLSADALDADTGASSATDGRNRRLNVGLDLKFNRAGHEVAGWTRKDASMGWQYSPALAQVIRDYAAEFPELFRCLATGSVNDSVDLSAERVWGSSPPPVEQLTGFLRRLPCAGAERVPVGSSILSGRSVGLIRRALDAQLPRLPNPEVSARELPASSLYRCQSDTRHCLPDPAAVHRLKDRVVVCRPGSGPPLDSTGTIIGIRACVSESDPELELLMDEPFEGSATIRGVDGCCLVSRTAVLNLSHGERTNPNNRYTVACQDRPDQHIQLWTDLQQQKQQQQYSHNKQQQKQFLQQLMKQQQQSPQQQQQQQQQPGSFNFSALVSAIQQQQPKPPQQQQQQPAPFAEQKAQRMLDSLLVEWDWPPPSIDFQVYGPGSSSAVIRFPNGFVLESKPMRSRAEAKLNAVEQLCDYCDSLKVQQQPQQQHHQRQKSQQQQQQSNKPTSNYTYQAAAPVQKQQQQQQPQQAAKAQAVEQALRAMLQIPTPAAQPAPETTAAQPTAATIPKQQQQQQQQKSPNGAEAGGGKKPSKSGSAKKRLGINFNQMASQQP